MNSYLVIGEIEWKDELGNEQGEFCIVPRRWSNAENGNSSIRYTRARTLDKLRKEKNVYAKDIKRESWNAIVLTVPMLEQWLSFVKGKSIECSD